MNNFLKLKIEWPGLSKDDLVAVTKGFGTVTFAGACPEWTIPLECNGMEVVVRHATLPLQDCSEAIHVRELGDLEHFVTLRAEGGLHRLLRVAEVKQVTDSIDAGLGRFQDRLKPGGKVYVFAAHRNAAKCVRYCQDIGLEVAGFVDNDKAKQGNKYYGLPIFSLEAIDRDATIINASGRYCVEIDQQLQQAGYCWGIDLMELLFLFDLPFQAEGNFRRYITDIFENRMRIATLYMMLADDHSRSVLDGLLLFRLTLDATNVGKIASPYREEFFAEDVLSFLPGEVFVDGGAFDGDSYERFAQMAPEYSKAYLFEPDGVICERAEQRVGADRRVSICNFGLWSRTGELRFSSTGGMDGAICEDGDIRIQVVAVDEFVQDKVSHIKLDVEGAEEEALFGASRHIADSRPKMAVALYHRAADLWQIPQLIEALGGQYKFSIRHYSQTVDDSIVYALPIN